MNIIMNGKIYDIKPAGRRRDKRDADPDFRTFGRFNTRGKMPGKVSPNGEIRITSGEFKGRKLVSPHQAATHPMGSRERLALFNAIGPHIKNKVVLDAFSGTGSLGLEALSRGARHVTFVEKNHKAAEALRQNIKTLNCSDRARVFECGVEEIDFDRPYDIVLADPPYNYYRASLFDYAHMEEITKVLSRLAHTARELFVLSHASEFDPHSIDAKLLGTHAYAGARISNYKGNPQPKLAAGKDQKKIAAGEETKQLEQPKEQKKLAEPDTKKLANPETKRLAAK